MGGEPEPSQLFRAWLLRYMRDCAHEIAVKTTTHIVVPTAVALLGAALAQTHFDWVGKAETAIGEWHTTVKPASPR